jgi:hypothetical protein
LGVVQLDRRNVSSFASLSDIRAIKRLFAGNGDLFMTRLSIMLAAVAVAGASLLATTPYARAGGDLEYNHGGGRHSGGCVTGVRAVGKGWPFPSIARRSAIRAWEREARYVHGEAYAYWDHAHHQDIECKYINAISQRCEARANPCRS